MAKSTYNFDDFLEGTEGDYNEEDENLNNEEGSEEEEENEDEDQEDDEPKASKKKKKKTTIIEEEEEESPKKEKPKAKAKKVEEPAEEEEEEEEVKPKKPVAKTTEDTEETEEGDEPNSQQFFEEVEKITGKAVEVDYGDVDPLTPQGVALREKALKETYINDMLAEIEENYPEAYRALQHAYAGGDISELFKSAGSRDYTTVQLKEGEDATAKEILREYYQKHGVKTQERINKLIELAEDSENGLYEEAKGALEELAAEQSEERTKIVETQRRAAEEDRKRDQLLLTAIDDVVSTRKLGNFRISDPVEAREFQKFVRSNIRKLGDGKYELSTTVNQSELEKQLQFQYFQFKKGDLSQMIQQKAATLNANKLKLKINEENSKAKRKTEQDARTFGCSLKDFDEQ
jgi:hypothetical protein